MQILLGGTLGPACDDERVLAAMLETGLGLARVNLAHPPQAAHRARAAATRRLASRVGRRVLVLADLPGPKRRVGVFPGGALLLREGDAVALHPGVERAPRGGIPIPDARLAPRLVRGRTLRLDDGRLELRVEREARGHVRAVVVRGGVLRNRKGLNLPGVPLPPGPGPDMLRAEQSARRLRADAVALSFVAGPREVRALQRRLGRPVWAKVERSDALDRLDAIAEAADGLLVARGDLGAECGIDAVPGLQRAILAAARRAGRPAMVATGLLPSFLGRGRPTRAERADVAAALDQGARALLLTDETAVGRDPAGAVAALAWIARGWRKRVGVEPTLDPEGPNDWF